MRCQFATLLAAFLTLQVLAAEPAATPTPGQQMASEIANLRGAQLIASGLRQKPPTAEEIAATDKLFRDLIRRFPKEAEPHVAFGEFLHSVEQNEAAFNEWQTALSLDSTRHDVLAAQADLMVQSGQIVAATDTFEKAVALEPKNAAYHFGLAHLYSMFRSDLVASRQASPNDLITRGTEHFRLAANLAPDNLVYLQAYAEAFYTQPKPDWSLARATWESLLSRSPDKDFVHAHLVRINIRLRDKSAALEHLAQLTNPAFAGMRESLRKQVDKL